MAIGVIAVVRMVSRLRVTWRMVRPVRTAVSPKKCVVIVVPYFLLDRVSWSWLLLLASRGLVVFAGVADDREEDILEGRLLLDVFDLGGRQQLFELGQGAVDDDRALVEDRYLVGKLFGLVEVLSREQHGRAALDQLLDGLPHLDARLRVQTGRRLVEEDDRRI